MNEDRMIKDNRVEKILHVLDENYSGLRCYLEYSTPWQLLVATVLSAQCTDARVNIVTKDLFSRYPEPKELAAADTAELEKIIHSVGFYHSKAAHIKELSCRLLSDYGGELPSDIDKLTKLPGVGRKTANVIRSHIFNIPSIVVDTHVKRVSKILGLTKADDPEKVEYDLMKLLPEEHWIRYNLQIIAHGRAVCISGRPKCTECCLSECCNNCQAEYNKLLTAKEENSK